MIIPLECNMNVLCSIYYPDELIKNAIRQPTCSDPVVIGLGRCLNSGVSGFGNC